MYIYIVDDFVLESLVLVLVAIDEAMRQYRTRSIEVVFIVMIISRIPRAIFQGLFGTWTLFKRFDRLNKSYRLFSYVLQKNNTRS